MTNEQDTFNQSLQVLISTLKYQFPIIRALPVTNQYFKDILQLLKQNKLLPERPLKRLEAVQGFISDPETIDQQTEPYMRTLLDYYHVTAATKDVQSSSESRLAKLFAQLDVSAPLAVVDGYTELSKLQTYLNIELPTQKILRQLATTLASTNRSLTLICGESGTGKSQLLANLKTKHAKLLALPNLKIKDDIGLSNDPNVTMDEQLLLDFHNFNDHELSSQTTYHQIATIHTDLLKHFYHLAKKLGTYMALTELLATTKLFSDHPENVITRNIQIIFVDRQMACPILKTTNEKTLFNQLTNKIFAANPYKNPFYQAYQSDVNQNIHSALHTNYHILTHPQVLESIQNLLVKAQIRHNSIFSIREILTFLHDITVPNIGQQPLTNTIFFLMFPEQPETRVLKCLADCDPATFRAPKLAILLGRFHRATDKQAFVLAIFKEHDLPRQWIPSFYSYYITNVTSEVAITHLLFRMLFLFDHTLAAFKDKTYELYLGCFEKVSQGYLSQTLVDFCDIGLKAWFQAPDIKSPLPKTSIYYMTTNQTGLLIHLAIKHQESERHYSFQLTLTLFELFYKLANHYILRRQDRQTVESFDHFIKTLATSLDNPDLIKEA